MTYSLIKDVIEKPTVIKWSDFIYDSFCYIDISSIDRESKCIIETTTIDKENAPSRAKYLVKEHDILVSTVRPNLNAVALVRDNNIGAVASSGFCVLRSKETKIEPRFLFYFSQTNIFINYLVKNATGASYPAVNDSTIKSLQIPIPPLLIQRKIVQVLDKAQELIDFREQQLKLLDELVQSVFHDMFGDPVINPKGWKQKALKEICNRIIDCPHSTPEWSNKGIICLRTSNLTYGAWDWTDTRFVDLKQYEERTKRSIIESGDVILSREGTVGIAAIVPDNIKLCMGQRLVQVRPNHKMLNAQYLLRILLFELDPIMIQFIMAGSTSKHLNMKDLRVMNIPLPPISLQNEFAEKVQKIEEQKAIMQESLQQMKDNFNSLMQRAFRGELFPE